MMATDNRTNGWGWAGLILVAALVGAGFLYQREGGKLFGPNEPEQATGTRHLADQVPPPVIDAEPPNPPPATADSTLAQDDAPIAPTDVSTTPAKSPERPVKRTTPGRVFVGIDAPTWHGRPGIWIYVDRKLVHYHDNPQSINSVTKEFELIPGKHTIEGCRRTLLPTVKSGVLPFPLQFESQQVVVEPGSKQSVTLELPEREPAEGTNYGESAIEDLSEDALRDWEAKATAKIVRYADDKLVKALKSQQARKPKTSKIELQIPEEYGGPREVDAAQVWIIIAWIKSYYWRDWPSRVGRDIRADSLLTPSECEVRRQLQVLQATVVDKNMQDIYELNGLARMLDEAGP